MQSNSKNYASVQDDEKTELVLWNLHALDTWKIYAYIGS